MPYEHLKCARCFRDELTLRSKLGMVTLVYPFESDKVSNVKKLPMCIPHLNTIADWCNTRMKKLPKSVPYPQLKMENF